MYSVWLSKSIVIVHHTQSDQGVISVYHVFDSSVTKSGLLEKKDSSFETSIEINNYADWTDWSLMSIYDIDINISTSS